LPWADPRRGWDFISTGHGDVPWEDAIRMLNSIGYEGPLSAEWEDAGMDRLIEAPQAQEFVRRLSIDPSDAACDAAFSTRSIDSFVTWSVRSCSGLTIGRAKYRTRRRGGAGAAAGGRDAGGLATSVRPVASRSHGRASDTAHPQARERC